MTDREDDFTLTYTFDAPPERVYAAVATRNGIAAWWTSDTHYDDQLDSIINVQFPGNGFFAKLRVVALKPRSFVRWACIDAAHPPETGFVDLKDWVGTEITFDIKPSGESASRLVFTHIGLAPLECAGMCSSIWSFYIGTSLRGLVENGAGQPHHG